MLSHNLAKFIDGLIEDNDYSLQVGDLNITEKKIILSYLVTQTEYEEICQSISLLESYFKESKKFIKELIEDRMAEMESHSNYEKGLFPCKDKITGETIWKQHYSR